MFKNKYDTPITTLQVVPAEETLTGTINVAASSTVVQGTGTDFWHETSAGDFLWANNELREIKSISISFQVLNVNAPFTAPVVAAAFEVVKKAQIKTLSLRNNGGAAAIVDGNTLPNGGSITFNRDSSNIGGDEFIDPVIVNGTGTSVAVLKIQ